MKTIAVEDSWLATDNALQVEWNLGKRCNFNCSYCNINLHDNFSSHLSFEVCKTTIDTLIAKTNKNIFISLTGGEPTVNPEFMKIIKYMHDKIAHISLTTNGSRTTNFYLELMQYIDNIIFSYHMEYHSRDKILHNILSCNKEKNVRCQQVAVHVMMLPTMFEEAKEVLRILKEQDGIKIIMRRIRPAFEVDNPINEYDNDGRLVKGTIARPFYGDRTSKTSILLYHKGKPKLGPDYGKADDYYSTEELKFLNEYKV